MNRSLVIAVPLLVLLTVLQTAVLPHLRIAGVIPQLALLAPISWGLRRGAAEGMVWAFIAGMLLDLFSFSPVGATVLALMGAILVIIQVQQVLPENLLLPILLTGLAFAIFLLLDLVLLRLTGHRFSWQNMSLLPTAVVVHAVLGLPAYWLAFYLDRLLYPRQIEV